MNPHWTYPYVNLQNNHFASVTSYIFKCHEKSGLPNTRLYADSKARFED